MPDNAPLLRSPTAADRLVALRQELAALEVDGLLVPRGDEFQGEFVAPYAERLAWLTGFSGSAGTAIVLGETAAIFVDGRYTLQVRAQVDADLYAYKHLIDEPPAIWLANTATPGQRIGFDPHLHTPDQITRYRDAVKKAGADLVPLPHNPIDAIWDDQPARPKAPAQVHGMSFSGRGSPNKREDVAKVLRADKIDAVYLTAPEDICWLFNIRGADVPYTPLVLATALLFADGKAVLFIDPAKVSNDLLAHLGEDVRVAPADGLGAALDALGDNAKIIATDRATTSQWAVDRIEAAGFECKAITDPCSLLKACKNDIELDGIRAAHVRDGAALTRFLAWLDGAAAKGGLNETEASDRLEAFRREDNLFQGPSFPTISGAGANGAIVHYRADPDTAAAIEPDMLYLVDSGGQYLDGTTDVTRTVAIGATTPEQRRRFTQVLKGHIALATAVFPEGTAGGQLDVLARAALWQDGVDYDHGTGHGVGAYLGVHEGPQRIGKANSAVPLKPGMVVSNEPGYYKTGEFGIRIENLVTVVIARKPEGAEKPLFAFETLTLAPIDRRLVDPALLTDQEREWFNAYHARVRETLTPHLDADTAAWLADATAPV